jgi:hypothetical protein
MMVVQVLYLCKMMHDESERGTSVHVHRDRAELMLETKSCADQGWLLPFPSTTCVSALYKLSFGGMTLPPLFPADVWYGILQHLAEASVRPQGLSAHRSNGIRRPSHMSIISLTCRFFAAATRRHLFKYIIVHDVPRCDGLLRLIASNGHLIS